MLGELLDHSTVQYRDVNAGLTSMVIIGWNKWQWTALSDAAQPAVKRAPTCAAATSSLL